MIDIIERVFIVTNSICIEPRYGVCLMGVRPC